MKLKGPDVRVPGVVGDLYRDLRDRRLLAIAIALVAAMIAVPFLVEGTEAEPVAPASLSGAAAGGDDATALDPAVLTEVPTLRDFQKRLNGLPSRNPFKPQKTGVPGGAAADTTGGGGGEGGSTLQTEESLSTTTGGTDVSAPITGGAISETPSSTEEIVPVEPVEPEPAPTEVPSDEGEGGTRMLTTRIDVRVGPVGKTRVLQDVKSLSLLPDEDRPLVQYLRGEFDETAAAFIVSNEITKTEGEGKCSPDRARCEFLILEVGEEQTFVYGPDGKNYRLELLDVNLHEAPMSSGGKGKQRSSPDGGFDASGYLGAVVEG